MDKVPGVELYTKGLKKFVSQCQSVSNDIVIMIKIKYMCEFFKPLIICNFCLCFHFINVWPLISNRASYILLSYIFKIASSFV